MGRIILDLWPVFLATGATLAAVVKFILDAHKIRESQLKLKETRLRIRELEQKLEEKESRVIRPTEDNVIEYSLTTQAISRGLPFVAMGLVALFFVSYSQVASTYHGKAEKLVAENEALASANQQLMHEIQQLAGTTDPPADFPPKVEVRLAGVDDKLIVFLNSHRVASAVFGQSAGWIDVSGFVTPGNNTLLYFVENNSGPCSGEVLVRIDGHERPELHWRRTESENRPAGECLTGRGEFEV